jgi:hypothetical protein
MPELEALYLEHEKLGDASEEPTPSLSPYPYPCPYPYP